MICILRKILFTFLYLLTSGLISYGQNCTITIKGIIKDAHENHQLEFATLYIQEVDRGVISDEKGQFLIDSICAGNYHFVFSHIGCGVITQFINIRKDTFLNIVLEHHDELLDEIIIEGQSRNTKTGLIKSVISKELLIEKSGSNLTEILATVPGVSILRSGPNLTKPIIQGLYGNRITILNHGIPQEGQQWGNDHAPEIDPNTSDKISVYKGASAIKYGLSALGGVILLEPKELTYDPHWHGEVRMSGQSNGKAYGIHASLLKSMKWGNTKWTAGFSNAGDRHTPEYILTNTGNRERSFSMLWSNNPAAKSYRKLYYSFYQNNIGILRGSHIGNLTDLMNAFDRDIPFFTADTFSYRIQAPRQQVNHHLLKYSHHYTITDDYQLTFDAGLQTNIRKEFDVRRGGRSNIPSLDLFLFSQFYDVQLDRQNSATSARQSIGIQYKNNINTNIPGTGIRPLIPDYINHYTAAYFINKNRWASWQLESGLRAEYRNYHIIGREEIIGNPRHQFLNFAGNVGLRKDISKSLYTSIDISFTERPAEINELYSNGLHQGVSGIEEGNPDILSEKSWKIVNEWNGHFSHDHQINISLFYNKFRNYIYLTPTEELRLTIRGAFPVFRYTGADVDMAGGSIRSNLNITENLLWTNTLHYTYAQNLTLDEGLIRIPPLNAISNLSYILGKGKYFNELKIGGEVNYTARQSRVNELEDFLPPPDGFLLVNAYLRLKWMPKSVNEVNLVIRGENLMNIKYRDYLNRLRYFADELGTNIFLTINISF